MEPQKKILVVFDFDLTLTKTHFGKHLSKIGRQILLSLHNKKHFISNNETKYTEQYVKLYKDKYSDQEYTYIPEKDLTQQELDIYLKLLDDIIEEIGGFKKENFRDPDKLTTYLKKLKEKYNIIFCISTAGARFPVIKMVERIYPDIFDPDLINYDFYEFGGTMFKKNKT